MCCQIVLTITVILCISISTFLSLRHKAKECKWLTPIMQDAFRHIYQRYILESDEKVLEFVYKVSTCSIWVVVIIIILIIIIMIIIVIIIIKIITIIIIIVIIIIVKIIIITIIIIIIIIIVI